MSSNSRHRRPRPAVKVSGYVLVADHDDREPGEQIADTLVQARRDAHALIAVEHVVRVAVYRASERQRRPASLRGPDMTCALCAAKMRVERYCRVCDRTICSGCSRKVLGSVDVCHGCIPEDTSGRSSRQSYRLGTSMQARRYFELMRLKERGQLTAKKD
jgi:hypothetical protein